MKLFKNTCTIFAFLLLASCKKDGGNNPGYYLQMTINDTTENFNSGVYAQDFSGDITASFNIHGENNTAQQFTVSINHTFNRVITAGTYNKASLDSLYLPQINYTVKDTTAYNSAVQQASLHPLTITISQLTDKYAMGTFSGTLYKFNHPSDSLIITNGKFYVPVK